MVQIRHDDVFPGILPFDIAGIDKNMGARRRRKQEAIALSDIDSRQFPARLDNGVIAFVGKGYCKKNHAAK